jgi:hypothetical protein
MLPDTVSTEPLEEFIDYNRKVRKVHIEKNAHDYDKFKQNLEKKIMDIDSHEIMETMKNERREWIKQRIVADEKNEPPKQLKEFYKRLDVAPREQLDDGQKKAMEQIMKDKLKKEQEKKKKEEQGQFNRGMGLLILVLLYTGPTEEVKKLSENIEEFKSTFEKPSEFITGKDDIIKNLAKDEIYGNIEKRIEMEVDAIISVELTNQRTLWLKGKKDKLPKEPKPVVPVEKLGPGEKALVKIGIEDIFTDVYITLYSSSLPE